MNSKEFNKHRKMNLEISKINSISLFKRLETALDKIRNKKQIYSFTEKELSDIKKLKGNKSH